MKLSPQGHLEEAEHVGDDLQAAGGPSHPPPPHDVLALESLIFLFSFRK